MRRVHDGLEGPSSSIDTVSCRGWRKGLLSSVERLLVNDTLYLYRLLMPLRHKVKDARARSWGAAPHPAPLWGQSGGKAF